MNKIAASLFKEKKLEQKPKTLLYKNITLHCIKTYLFYLPFGNSIQTYVLKGFLLFPIWGARIWEAQNGETNRSMGVELWRNKNFVSDDLVSMAVFCNTNEFWFLKGEKCRVNEKIFAGNLNYLQLQKKFKVFNKRMF